MAAFVLVHGAFQGAHVWREVAAYLRLAGHEVLTPTLTGLGDRSHLADSVRGLTHYVQDVELAILYEQVTDIVLVGHSWSGLILPAVADCLPGRVLRLVFVDAVLPEIGKSFVDLAGPQFEQLLSAHCDGVRIRPWPLPMFGLADDGEKAKQFAARLTPMPVAAFRDAYTGPDWTRWQHPTFIRCLRTKNPLLGAMAQLAEKRDWERTAIDTDHNPMTTHPDVLANALLTVSGLTPRAQGSN